MDSKLCDLGEGEAIQMEQKFSRGYLDHCKLLQLTLVVIWAGFR